MTRNWATKVAHLQMIEVDALSRDECTQLREHIRTLLSQAMTASLVGELAPRTGKFARCWSKSTKRHCAARENKSNCRKSYFG